MLQGLLDEGQRVELQKLSRLGQIGSFGVQKLFKTVYFPLLNFFPFLSLDYGRIDVINEEIDSQIKLQLFLFSKKFKNRKELLPIALIMTSKYLW
jgi:hypothetical protein